MKRWQRENAEHIVELSGFTQRVNLIPNEPSVFQDRILYYGAVSPMNQCFVSELPYRRIKCDKNESGNKAIY